MRGPGQTDGRKAGRIALVVYVLLTFAFEGYLAKGEEVA